MLVYKNMLSEVMSWREAPLKFSPRVTAARGIVSTNPTGRTSVRLSAHRFAAVSNLSPLAHRPSTRSGRPIKGGRNIPCCFLVGVVVRHPLLKKKKVVRHPVIPPQKGKQIFF